MVRGKIVYTALALSLVSGTALAQGPADKWQGGKRYVVPNRVSLPMPDEDTSIRRAPAIARGQQAVPYYTPAAPRPVPQAYSAPAPLPQAEPMPAPAVMQEPAPAYTYESVEAAVTPQEPSSSSSSGWGMAGGVNFTTDYVWRGYTQTDANPAVQGYITAKYGSGLSATLWGSNVDFDDGDQAHIEVDTTIAYAFDLGPGSMTLGGGITGIRARTRRSTMITASSPSITITACSTICSR